ncbi:hypothetical protein BKA12_000186 [Neomicrococcus lactis]|uniref:Uncharacterized protein n=1 Tax=Neomicrococcus lactis TaxID=732241 RepID=A0A7W8Y931_9MICC|nr:hypothetical protein [Neomicrococcus lactis]
MIDDAVTSTAGNISKDKTYVVHAQCEGSGTMSYELLVDSKFVSGGSWECSSDIVNSGVDSTSGKAQLRLTDPTSGNQSWAVIYLSSEE